jgi:hypothetical protein
MNDICGINRITPRWGLDWWGDLFRRALPYAIDNRLSAYNCIIMFPPTINNRLSACNGIVIFPPTIDYMFSSFGTVKKKAK